VKKLGLEVKYACAQARKMWKVLGALIDMNGKFDNKS